MAPAVEVTSAAFTSVAAAPVSLVAAGTRITETMSPTSSPSDGARPALQADTDQRAGGRDGLGPVLGEVVRCDELVLVQPGRGVAADVLARLRPRDQAAGRTGQVAAGQILGLDPVPGRELVGGDRDEVRTGCRCAPRSGRTRRRRAGSGSPPARPGRDAAPGRSGGGSHHRPPIGPLRGCLGRVYAWRTRDSRAYRNGSEVPTGPPGRCRYRLATRSRSTVVSSSVNAPGPPYNWSR